MTDSPVLPQVIGLWCCPVHEWTFDYFYSDADKTPRCPKWVDPKVSCGQPLAGPFRTTVEAVVVEVSG